MKRLTDEQKIEIIEKYKTGLYSCIDLDREYNMSRGSVHGLLKRRNIPANSMKSLSHRKYNLDEFCFDIIDTEEKAYFLGLLYADGCNYTNSNQIAISLTEIDKELLEKFSLFLNSNRPLYFIKGRFTHKKGDKKGYLGKNQYSLRVNSKRMSDRLSELGCVPKKSLILKFPTEDQVPEHLLRHFIRGYWDGDGSFTFNNKSKYWSLSTEITSASDFCFGMQETIKNLIDVSFLSRYRKNRYSDNTKVLHMGGILKTLKFLNWLYSDANIYMERKYKKFQVIKSILNEKGYE